MLSQVRYPYSKTADYTLKSSAFPQTGMDIAGVRPEPRYINARGGRSQ
jgi:hypothetical protein